MATNHNRVRKALRESLQDGATAEELAKHLGAQMNSVLQALKAMPDVYIDRWTKAPANGRYSAVYCVAEIPPNCPKPDPVVAPAGPPKRSYVRKAAHKAKAIPLPQPEITT